MDTTELEQALLAAYIIDDGRSVELTAEYIKADDFTKESHRKIYLACIDLWSRNEAIDALSVCSKLDKLGLLQYVGGAAYVVGLSNKLPSASNSESYAKTIADESRKRKIKQKCRETEIKVDSSDSSNEIIDEIENWASELRFNINKEPSLYDIGKQILDDAETAQQLGFNPSIVDMGFGVHYRKGTLNILAARPGMGKTTLMLNMAYNMAKKNEPVGVLHLEMSSEQLTEKLLAIDSKVDVGKLKSGVFGNREIELVKASVDRLPTLPIYQMESSGVNELELTARAKIMKRKHNIKALFIDYMQLIGCSKFYGNKVVEVGVVSKQCKEIAKSIDVPVIVLSQLSRMLETRKEKRPTLSDLRDSGNIEQDADTVKFIHREDYYADKKNMPDVSLCEIITEKDRFGGLSTRELMFNKPYSLFTEVER